jgi:hypothetical protein
MFPAFHGYLDSVDSNHPQKSHNTTSYRIQISYTTQPLYTITGLHKQSKKPQNTTNMENQLKKEWALTNFNNIQQ